MCKNSKVNPEPKHIDAGWHDDQTNDAGKEMFPDMILVRR